MPRQRRDNTHHENKAGRTVNHESYFRIKVYGIGFFLEPLNFLLIPSFNAFKSSII
jgi:hypothetical protein